MRIKHRIIPVIQGEFRITDSPEDIMTTVLGSCIAACIWDEKKKLGGMNHFLLAGPNEPKDGNLKYGINSMELLINGLLRAGASRNNLKAKVFGGAKMIMNSQEIGLENAEFTKWFLDIEGIPIISTCVGGKKGRKVRFEPTTGAAQRLYLGNPNEIDRTWSNRMATATIGRTKDTNRIHDIEIF